MPAEVARVVALGASNLTRGFQTDLLCVYLFRVAFA
jgi:hypothetical protein